MRQLLRGRSAIAFYFGVLTILMFMLVGVSSAQTTDVAVIVNPDNPVTNVSLVDLRKIFSGSKRTWPGGLPIKPLVRAPGCHERTVLLSLLGMSEGEYKQYWTAQIFRGEADAQPAILPSFGMALEAARAFRGAIAFAEARDIKPGTFIKVIKVDGYMPGEEGYPLH